MIEEIVAGGSESSDGEIEEPGATQVQNAMAAGVVEVDLEDDCVPDWMSASGFPAKSPAVLTSALPLPIVKVSEASGQGETAQLRDVTALKALLKQAQQTIFGAGWDLGSRIKLARQSLSLLIQSVDREHELIKRAKSALSRLKSKARKHGVVHERLVVVGDEGVESTPPEPVDVPRAKLRPFAAGVPDSARRALLKARDAGLPVPPLPKNWDGPWGSGTGHVEEQGFWGMELKAKCASKPKPPAGRPPARL